MRRKLIGIVITGLVIAAVAAVGYRRATQARTHVPQPVIKPAVVRTSPLKLTSRPKIESFYGFIEAAARVDMAFQIPGRLEQIGASEDQSLRENQVVEKGDVIATLELDRYEAKLRQAEALIAKARAAMARTQATVAQAKAKYDDALREFNRIRRLFERRAASQNEYEKAKVLRDTAKAVLDAATAELEAAKADYEVANADREQARIHVEDATLRAPFRGVVAAIPTEIGQMIQPSQPVITLVDLTSVRLVAGVTENKAPLLKEGQVVEVQVTALQSGASTPFERLYGRVSVVPPAANRTTRLFDVEIEIDNRQVGDAWLLKPGMVARANVYVKDDPAMAVPADAAVRVSDGKLWAYFVRHGYEVGLDLGSAGSHRVHVPSPTAELTMLPIVETRMDSYLVSDVPAWGEQLVVEGQTRLADGQPVIVLGRTPDGEGRDTADSTASDP